MDPDIPSEILAKKAQNNVGDQLCNGDPAKVNGKVCEGSDATDIEMTDVSATAEKCTNGEKSNSEANGVTNGNKDEDELIKSTTQNGDAHKETSTMDVDENSLSSIENDKQAKTSDCNGDKTGVDKEETVSPMETDTDKKTQAEENAEPEPPKPLVDHFAYLDKGLAEYEELRPVAELLFTVGLNISKQYVYEDLSRVHTKQKKDDCLSEHGKEFGESYVEKYKKIGDDNEPYKLNMTKCKECDFQTESENVLQWHLEFAHGQDNNMYHCSFCDFTGKQPGEFFFHMEAEHSRKGRIYMKHAFFSCALCPFENNSRKALMKHQSKCEKSFKVKRNLEPAPTDCDIPLKLVKPRVPVPKPAPPKPIQPAPTVKSIMQNRIQQQNQADLSRMNRPGMISQRQQQASPQSMLPLLPRAMSTPQQQALMQQLQMQNQRMNAPYMQNVQQLAAAAVNAAAISQVRQAQPQAPLQPPPLQKAPKPASNNNTPSVPTGAASRFEVCEICGGFVKDRESLRVHFYWAHKVDIQKNVFDRKQPHLMCEFCPQRFWTYQGLARHRQITHNKEQQQQQLQQQQSAGSPSSKSNSKPQHNCILCGAVNVPHLLNHLSNSHGITLQTMFKQKRCLCCGASFSEEKSLEKHMLNSHSDLFRIKPHSKNSQSKSGKSSPTGSPKSVSCPICKAKFPNSATFDDHFSNMHSHKCHRCEQQYSAQDMLSKHWHEVHAKESEPCQICDDVVRIGRPYLRHLRSSHLINCSVRFTRLNKEATEWMLTGKRHADYVRPGPQSKKKKLAVEAAKKRSLAIQRAAAMERRANERAKLEAEEKAAKDHVNEQSVEQSSTESIGDHEVPKSDSAAANEAIDVPKSDSATTDEAMDVPKSDSATTDEAMDVPKSDSATTDEAMDVPKSDSATTDEAMDVPKSDSATTDEAMDVPKSDSATTDEAMDGANVDNKSDEVKSPETEQTE